MKKTFIKWGFIGLLFLIMPLSVIFGKNGLPGVESKDPERFYQRMKFVRMKRPDDVQNTLQIANLYYSWKMEDEAIKEYRRCLKVDPANLDAKWFLSHLLYNKGYFEEAFRLTREIMDKRTEDPEVYYWAGEILLKLDQRATAKEYFSRVDELLAPERGSPKAPLSY